MKGYRERALEEVHGDLMKVIPTLVNEVGQDETAKRLRVSQSFISVWLKRNDFKQVIKWEKKEVLTQK